MADTITISMTLAELLERFGAYPQPGVTMDHDDGDGAASWRIINVAMNWSEEYDPEGTVTLTLERLIDLPMD